MGCGTSSGKFPASDYHEKSMSSALLIQRWYRRYLARLEAKRRTTWSIFQSLEYAGEQDQLRLYNFFNDMMLQLELASTADSSESRSGVIKSMALFKHPESIEEVDSEIWKETNPDSITIPAGYKGPHIKFPLTTNQIQCLIDSFKEKKLLHAKYVLAVLHETRRALKQLPNVQHVPVTKGAKQLTVIGDLHGKLDDLLMIFYKNGLPDRNNPYLFNGDIVDRGPQSVELCILIFCHMLLYPGAVHVNRGNHEDHVMNLRYGFIKEIIDKYKEHSAKVVSLFEDVFSWLPLATVIDKRILVTHGGISDKTDLQALEKLDRNSYVSILRPPRGDDGIDALAWRQIQDIMWSDPRTKRGCAPNDFRGGGCYWGPDVTARLLDRHGYKLLIRSHECKEEGYEYTHGDRVLTIFSASNYYEEGSNKGAYIKIDAKLEVRIVQFIVSKQAQKKMSSSTRLNAVEASAMRNLRQKIYAHQTALNEEFEKHDTNNTGCITLTQWSDVMRRLLGMDLPWRNLKDKLVKSNPSGLVQYKTTFEQFKVKNKMKEQTGDLTEALYRNKDSLETIFRAIDKDNSGSISVTEFTEACELLSEHTGTPLSKSEIRNMARNIDMNNDGFIDFNEFLEAFRIVDNFGRELQKRTSEKQFSLASQEKKTGEKKVAKPQAIMEN